MPRHFGELPRFDGFYIEDKASGTGLIQMLQAQTAIPVQAVTRSREKVGRANDVLPLVAVGLLHVPDGSPWAEELVSEICAFSPAMTHAHDDIVDTVMAGLGLFFEERGKPFGGNGSVMKADVEAGWTR